MLRLSIVSFTKMLITYFATRIDEIVRRPIFIMKGVPDFIVTIDSNGVSDAKSLGRLSYVGLLFFDVEFRSVDTDHHKAGIFVFVGPSPDIRN
jgi:hypothetical protein